MPGEGSLSKLTTPQGVSYVQPGRPLMKYESGAGTVLNADIVYAGAGAPRSGPDGTGAGFLGLGALYRDKERGTVWFNEGTIVSPYWTPISPNQPGLVAVGARHFEGSSEHLAAATATSAKISPSGLTVLGDGVHETDSSALVQVTEAGGVCPIRLTTSDAVGDLAGLAMSVLAGAGVFQPDENKFGIIDATVRHVSAITGRIGFTGFVGLAPVGLTDVATIATTVITLVDDDLFGVMFDASAGDADRLYVAHNKSNEAADQTTTDGSRDTGVNIPAAGTKQRQRVEVDEDGHGRVFLDKVQVYNSRDVDPDEPVLDANEEANPVVSISPTATSVVAMDVLAAHIYMGVV